MKWPHQQILSPRFVAGFARKTDYAKAIVIEKGFESVTIGAVEKYVTETAFEEGWVAPIEVSHERGQSVGIIGSGPAGLAAADLLRRKGYQVTVYDRYDRVGGLMIYGIPGFKLEKEIVTRRAALLEQGGIKFVLNCEIGKDITFDELREKHDSVLIATGVYKARDIKIPGIGLDGVVPALDYLTASNRKSLGDDVAHYENGTLNAAGKDVVVVGGGDTAMDCVRTAVRQQAEQVFCVYRRDEENMPGSRREVQNAREEGVTFLFNRQPVGVLDYFGEAIGVKVVETRLGEPGADGRRRPEHVAGSEAIIEADAIIMAFGFQPSPTEWMANMDIALNDWKGVIAPEQQVFKFQTPNPKVFAGGDMVRGSDLVVTAIWEGRQAAEGILDYLAV